MRPALGIIRLNGATNARRAVHRPRVRRCLATAASNMGNSTWYCSRSNALASARVRTTAFWPVTETPVGKCTSDTVRRRVVTAGWPFRFPMPPPERQNTSRGSSDQRRTRLRYISTALGIVSLNGTSNYRRVARRIHSVAVAVTAYSRAGSARSRGSSCMTDTLVYALRCPCGAEVTFPDDKRGFWFACGCGKRYCAPHRKILAQRLIGTLVWAWRTWRLPRRRPVALAAARSPYRAEAPIRCPLCAGVPAPEHRWGCQFCACAWNTFATRGRCPGCHFRYRATLCLACRRVSRHDDWYAREG